MWDKIKWNNKTKLPQPSLLYDVSRNVEKDNHTMEYGLGPENPACTIKPNLTWAQPPHFNKAAQPEGTLRENYRMGATDPQPPALFPTLSIYLVLWIEIKCFI